MEYILQESEHEDDTELQPVITKKLQKPLIN